MAEEPIFSTLKASKIFQGLSDADLKHIAAAGRCRRFDAGKTIIREGQTDHGLFIIICGQVEAVLLKSSATGQPERATRIRLGGLRHGDCIGEYSLIDGLPASATVLATEACELFELPRDAFIKIVNTGDRLARYIFENLLHLMIARARERNRELDLCY